MLHKKVFKILCESLRKSIESFEVGSFESIMSEAKIAYETMSSDMPYIEDPTHSMAEATFICCSYLAIFIPLRSRGISAHIWGGIILNKVDYDSPAEDSGHRFIQDSEKSLTDSKPYEFVFEFVPGDGTSKEWGMNIKSCSLCTIYSKYSAMALLPYMCAADDNTEPNISLARTGTIALGAHECDFRYKQGGVPKPLIDQFPDQIKSVPIE